MSDPDVFRQIMGGLIGRFMLIAREEGMSDEEICRVLSVQALLFAADLHMGNDESFIQMARRSLALVRTGAIEQ